MLRRMRSASLGLYVSALVVLSIKGEIAEPKDNPREQRQSAGPLKKNPDEIRRVRKAITLIKKFVKDGMPLDDFIKELTCTLNPLPQYQDAVTKLQEIISKGETRAPVIALAMHKFIGLFPEELKASLRKMGAWNAAMALFSINRGIDLQQQKKSGQQPS